MNRSIRSSWERKGSLHSMVCWVWSFNFKCIQSTVKSRRPGLAAFMNALATGARVV